MSSESPTPPRASFSREPARAWGFLLARRSFDYLRYAPCMASAPRCRAAPETPAMMGTEFVSRSYRRPVLPEGLLDSRLV